MMVDMFEVFIPDQKCKHASAVGKWLCTFKHFRQCRSDPSRGISSLWGKMHATTTSNYREDWRPHRNRPQSRWNLVSWWLVVPPVLQYRWPQQRQHGMQSLVTWILQLHPSHRWSLPLMYTILSNDYVLMTEFMLVL